MTKTVHKHTLTLSRRSPLVRLYARAWGADPAKADFCKLFWGTVLLPLAPLLWLLSRGAYALDRSDVPEKAEEFFAKPAPRAVARWTWRVYVVGLGAWWLFAIAKAIIEGKGLLVVGVVGGVLALAAVVVLVWRHFGGALRLGAKAVKANTCPRIEVR